MKVTFLKYVILLMLLNDLLFYIIHCMHITDLFILCRQNMYPCGFMRSWRRLSR